MDCHAQEQISSIIHVTGKIPRETSGLAARCRRIFATTWV